MTDVACMRGGSAVRRVLPFLLCAWLIAYAPPARAAAAAFPGRWFGAWNQRGALPALDGVARRGGELRAVSIAAAASTSGEPVGRYLHRLSTRAERTVRRLAVVLGSAGVVIASALLFVLVAAVSSAADLRMLALAAKRPRAFVRYLRRGMLTFLRILRDRSTPNPARLVLIAALAYWLVGVDLLPDQTLLPGLLDDLLIAAAAAKVFIYLCPDRLVAKHAAAVDWRALVRAPRPFTASVPVRGGRSHKTPGSR